MNKLLLLAGPLAPLVAVLLLLISGRRLANLSGVVAQLERTVGSDLISAVRGLGRRIPGPSVVLALSLLSLAGFIAKIFLFQAALEGGLTWLAVIGVINGVTWPGR